MIAVLVEDRAAYRANLSSILAIRNHAAYWFIDREINLLSQYWRKKTTNHFFFSGKDVRKYEICNWTLHRLHWTLGKTTIENIYFMFYNNNDVITKCEGTKVTYYIAI